MNRLWMVAAAIALLGCGEKERPPRAPLGPLGGTIRIGGGGGTRDAGVPDDDASFRRDGGPLPAWCQPITGGDDLAEVIELGEVERGVPFTPTTVTAKWSALFCDRDGRRFLRIGIAEHDRCDLWSVGDPSVHEIFLFVDVDAIRASELSPRGQPVVFEDDRVQVYYGRPGATLWGVCGELAGGSVDFESIGADVGDRIAVVLAVDLQDCVDPPLELPVRVEARIETVLQHTEEEACGGR